MYKNKKKAFSLTIDLDHIRFYLKHVFVLFYKYFVRRSVGQAKKGRNVKIWKRDFLDPWLRYTTVFFCAHSSFKWASILLIVCTSVIQRASLLMDVVILVYLVIYWYTVSDVIFLNLFNYPISKFASVHNAVCAVHQYSKLLPCRKKRVSSTELWILVDLTTSPPNAPF